MKNYHLLGDSRELVAVFSLNLNDRCYYPVNNKILCLYLYIAKINSLMVAYKKLLSVARIRLPLHISNLVKYCSFMRNKVINKQINHQHYHAYQKYGVYSGFKCHFWGFNLVLKQIRAYFDTISKTILSVNVNSITRLNRRYKYMPNCKIFKGIAIGTKIKH